nr:winged helix-turn-helix domain-containing protein [Acidimicrobiia bacterium]
VVTKGGAEVALTPTELRLLLELGRHPAQVLSRVQLLERVWDYNYLGDSRLVDVCVQRVRAKVEDDPTRPRLIQTVRGVGYKLVPPP